MVWNRLALPGWLKTWIVVVLPLGLFVALPSSAQDTDLDTSLARAGSLIQRGELTRAQAVLEAPLTRLGDDAPAAERAPVLARLGQVLVETGDTDRAALMLSDAVTLAEEAGLTELQAQALNDYGNAMASDDAEIALESYNDSVRLADGLPRPELALRGTINAARAELKLEQPDAAAARLQDAERRLQGLPAAQRTPLDSLAVAGVALELARSDPAYVQLAHRLIGEAETAAAAGTARDQSWALGFKGELYALQGRDREALALFRQAALKAEGARASEVLFRWQWYAGRLLAQDGQREAAIVAYRSAIRNLEVVRLDLPAFDPRTGQSLFRETLGPVFLEYADLLLQRARATGQDVAQADLIEARNAIERLKTVELQDYFGDDCAADLTAQIRPVDQLGGDTAVLYPVLLADRTELILSLPDGRLVSVRAPMPGSEVTDLARRLRRTIEVPGGGDSYLAPATALYDQLVRPVETLLDQNGVRTIVFVPDGALRNIPLGVLHDGQRFLIERWSVSTGLGLGLLDTRPLASRDFKVLVGGLTEARQGFSALPGVKREVEQIDQILKPEQTLFEQDFVEPSLESSLAQTPFNVVHLATHGQFTGDPDESFLLTYDDRLNMDELERLLKLSQFRDEPVDLLVLSACQTAAGDDRSALGLAGLAVKVGARSALATLWSLDDNSAVKMIPKFYEGLLNPGTNKAEALRQAQLPLIQDPATRHPFYWAPFLLVGNWV